MTLPVERARALRWGWEFLWELKSAKNLTSIQKAKALNILQSYPSSSETTAWASETSWLEAEATDTDTSKLHSGPSLAVDRAPITFSDRIDALAAASSFFHYELRGCNNLTKEQKRSLLYVCRHFPLSTEVDDIARQNAQANPAGDESAFIQRGRAAIARSVPVGDGIPAEAVIAKLEGKLAAARQRRAADHNASGVLKEHSSVTLVNPLPGLAQGSMGVVVHVHAEGRAYEVEFFDNSEKTIGVHTVEAANLRPVKE